MYFVVLGKNKQISLKELELVNPINLKVKGNIAIFDTDVSGSLSNLGGIIKWGELIDHDLIDKKCDMSDPKILFGVSSNDIGRMLKKDFGIKRYKIVESDKTDMEIKNGGVELIDMSGSDIGIVRGYQNIKIYETIDFDKPIRGMEIGMMPSKLTHILINLGIALINSNSSSVISNYTIYDPFAGFGTTGFMANYLGYDFIGSDINITSFKQNMKWWESSGYDNKDKKMTIFKHDINDKFDKPFLKNINLVVTEGWLGPTISARTQKNELEKNQDNIFDIYKKFINNINDFYDNIAVVFTMPIYIGKDNFVGERIKALLEDLNLKYEFIDEIYARKEHKVGRQIVLLTKKG